MVTKAMMTKIHLREKHRNLAHLPCNSCSPRSTGAEILALKIRCLEMKRRQATFTWPFYSKALQALQHLVHLTRTRTMIRFATIQSCLPPSLFSQKSSAYRTTRTRSWSTTWAAKTQPIQIEKTRSAKDTLKLISNSRQIQAPKTKSWCILCFQRQVWAKKGLEILKTSQSIRVAVTLVSSKLLSS